MGKLKAVWRVTRQTILILLITFVLAEIVLRVYNYIHPTFVFYDSSYNRFRGKANSPDYDFHLNSRGFKDVEFNTQKDPNTYRIVALGDSFAFAIVPYKNAYLTLLEENLSQNGKKTEVLNMGIPGTGPQDYLALLVNEGLSLKPDMVLVSFFIGNDFSESNEERKIYSYSYVASLISYLITVSKGYQGKVLHPNVDYADTEPTFKDPAFIGIESERSEIYRKQSKSFGNEFSTALNYLIQIKRQCDARNIRLTVALLPDEVQVNRVVQSRVLEVKAFNSSPDDFDFELPNRLLVTKLNELGIDCIDLLDDFARAEQKTSLYKPNDTHWNIAGNKLAAAIMAQRLPGLPEAAKPPDAAAAGSGPAVYEGFHDQTDCRSIKGWAWDALRPNDALKIEVYDGDTLIGAVGADLFRKDLLDAGKGNGAHAFAYAVPDQLKDGKTHEIRLKIAGRENALSGSPQQLRCGE